MYIFDMTLESEIFDMLGGQKQLHLCLLLETVIVHLIAMLGGGGGGNTKIPEYLTLCDSHVWDSCKGIN